MRRLIIACLFFSSLYLFAQQKGNTITIVGDSLTGKLVNGENLREVIGHVILSQGNIIITCNKATQYLLKNNAILEGDVIVKQNNLTIHADRGYYYGNERIAKCTTGVKLDDGKVILTAQNGDYYFNEDRAFFSNRVKLYDTVTTMRSNHLTYYKLEDKAIATGNVTIEDSINTILADSIIHFRKDKITYAEKNVKIVDAENNTVIYGNHLEDYSKKKYTLMTDFPLLIQIDTSKNSDKDSLLISSRIMESYNDSTKRFIAIDSVRIIRGEFASVNRYSILDRRQNKLITMKRKPEETFPVLWFELTQLTGDSIAVYLKDNTLEKIDVYRNGFILSQREDFIKRFDQMSGNQIAIYFDSLGINHTDVTGNVLSIYYTYEDSTANGLTKSSSQKAKIIFKDKKVDEVRMFGSPVSDYYPENLVENNELSYTLPAFILFKNRPVKDDLLKNNYFSKPINAVLEKN